MEKEKLSIILEAHSKWLSMDCDGEMADLRGADLRGAKLSGADLSGANLRGAKLSGADLRGANLSEANLSWADLSEANLSWADLSWANLSEAKLSGADLSEANLRGAKLSGADLSEANLSEANLSWANLSEANLSGAKLSGAKYNSCTAFYALQCPEAGEFTGYKSAGSYIVELKIPAAAKRSSATSRKCRCSEAQIMSITNPDGTPAEVSEVASNRDNHFVYHVGETVKVDDFCEDRWVECAAGIHFFITRDEAVNCM